MKSKKYWRRCKEFFIWLQLNHFKHFILLIINLIISLSGIGLIAFIWLYLDREDYPVKIFATILGLAGAVVLFMAGYKMVRKCWRIYVATIKKMKRNIFM